jgi:hypothetical protein
MRAWQAGYVFETTCDRSVTGCICSIGAKKLLLCGVQHPGHEQDRFGLRIENEDQKKMVDFNPCGIVMPYNN